MNKIKIIILFFIFVFINFSFQNASSSLIDQNLEDDPFFKGIDINDTSLEVNSASSGNISYVLTTFSQIKNYLFRFELIPTSDYSKEFLYFTLINNSNGAVISKSGYSVSEDIGIKAKVIINNILVYFYKLIAETQPQNVIEFNKISTFEKDIFKKNRGQKIRIVLDIENWIIEINDVGNDFMIDYIYCTSKTPSRFRKKIMLIELIPINYNLFGEVIKEFFINNIIKNDLLINMY
ncbi:MAG: hypothetical protein ACK4YF_09260 [Exilispira sp.]